MRALVDTGCTITMVRSSLVGDRVGESWMSAFDGRKVRCGGERPVNLEVGGTPVEVSAVAIEHLVGDLGVVLGMYVIEQLGGVTVRSNGVDFGAGQCLMARNEGCRAVSEREGPGRPQQIEDPAGALQGDDGEAAEICTIEDNDFRAKFDGQGWTVTYLFKGDLGPILTNSVSCYDRDLSGRKKEEFEREVDRWVEEGILMPWGERVESGILPLMAVEQQTKGKVRPVLDFRKLNEFVECHTGDNVADVCGDVLREWRQMEGEIAIVDLKSAYLQVRVAKELWQYQLVRYKGETYCLTRLGFGLSSAPRIMARILKYVLAKSDTIQASTKSYVDDILVKTSQVPAETLIAHLNRFGLVTKLPEQLDGGTALGLKVLKNGRGELAFTRGNEVPSVPESLTQRGLFSICGKLVGHYPVAGWLRVACSYVKRRAEGGRWDDYVGEEAASRLAEVIARVEREDPVQGQWLVPKGSAGVVWCDASSIATGVLLEIGGVVAEDAAWLRKKDDYGHINIAELEAVVRGVNLALKWGLREIEVVTDSATICGWMRLMLSEKRIKTK